MKNNRSELVFILDRSGSMAGLESDTIGGFNSMLDKQKKQEGEARITTVLFDDRYEKIHDRFHLEYIKHMTEKEYYVRGSTALFDAIGRSIRSMENLQKHMSKQERAKKVIFTIITDGLENSSREYTRESVGRMIRHAQEEYGWEFLFLGANMDAVKEAGSFGIAEDRAVSFINDRRGVQKNYAAVNEAVCRMRMEEPGQRMDGSWKEEIEKDYRSRS